MRPYCAGPQTRIHCAATVSGLKNVSHRKFNLRWKEVCCPNYSQIVSLVPLDSIGLTGVGNINQFRRLLKELATVHINRIIVAFDMDALINENVRNARQRVLQEGSDAGFEMTPIAWDEKYKGIDDLLLSFKEARAS